MCGRYQLLRPEDIAARFETVNNVPDLVASSDVRPTQSIPVVAMGREFALMQWGITPAWEKDKKKAPIINARAEGIETKVTFRQSLRFQRCIIPATGFYEWQAPAGGGQEGEVPVHARRWRLPGAGRCLRELQDARGTDDALVRHHHDNAQ